MENPNGAVQGNSQNIPEANVPRTRSTFPLGYHFFDTHRFGEYHPHYVEDGEKGDTLPVRSSHNVFSYTLKSPLMQNISMKKDYFSVPMEAILPLNWPKFYENPVRGDDVPTDCGPAVVDFWKKVATFMTNLSSGLSSILSDASQGNPSILQSVFRFLLIGEAFYSNGSLLSSLGCHGAPYVRINQNNKYISYDAFFDSMIATIVALQNADYFTLYVGSQSYDVVSDSNVNTYQGKISLRHALSLMRDDFTFTIGSVVTSVPLGSPLASALGNFTFTYRNATVPCNLKRLWAYQLVCAHYYSNDHIDFVYSAELFRQLVGSYVKLASPSGVLGSFAFFNFNGISCQYDYLSAKFFTELLSYYNTGTAASNLLTATLGSSRSFGTLGYLSALLSYRRSLRYLDYFTGSRAQPLAVGSTGVSVVNNTVDVVDVTRNIQRQRFLNAVNRVRHNFEGYLKGIFGGDVPAPDYHNPFFLAHTDDNIYGQETENTGAAQMTDSIAITSNLRSNGSRYMFEINVDRPSVVIGITYYDIPRVYTKTIERSFFHVDRFDMFNPFMQFIGDQPVYLQEIGIDVNSSLNTMANFSYALRNMEYKQRYNQCAGGFVENLPGFAFLALDSRGSQVYINPDWIRSVCSEFDNFYVSLNGWSNGSYFHFIVDNFNDCSGSRPMAYAPSIL